MDRLAEREFQEYWDEPAALLYGERSSPPVSVTIEIPLAEFPADAYLPRHLDGHLNLAQRTILKRLAVALDQSNARLADGKHVASHIDAVRWLLERIGESG